MNQEFLENIIEKVHYQAMNWMIREDKKEINLQNTDIREFMESLGLAKDREGMKDYYYADYMLYHLINIVKASNIISDFNSRWKSETSLITHDASKFQLANWISYRENFYGDKKGYRAAYDKSWMEHIHLNPHHWIIG